MFNLQQAVGDNAIYGFDPSVVGIDDHYEMLPCHCNAVHCSNLDDEQHQFMSQYCRHQPSSCLFTEDQMPVLPGSVWNEGHMRQVFDNPSQCSSPFTNYSHWPRTTQHLTTCDIVGSAEASFVYSANQAALHNATVWCNAEMVSNAHLARCSCRVIEMECSCANMTSLCYHSRTHLSNVTNVVHHSWNEFNHVPEFEQEFKMEVEDGWQSDWQSDSLANTAEWAVLSNPMLSDTRAPSRTDERLLEHDDMHDLHKLEFIFDKPLPDNLYYGMIAELNDNPMESEMQMTNDELEFVDDKTLMVLAKPNSDVLESPIEHVDNCAIQSVTNKFTSEYDQRLINMKCDSSSSSSELYQVPSCNSLELKIVEEGEVSRLPTQISPMIKATVKKCKPKIEIKSVRKSKSKSEMSRVPSKRSTKARFSFDLMKLLERCRKLKKAGKVEELRLILTEYDCDPLSQIGLIVDCLSKMYVKNNPSEAMRVLRNNHFETSYRRELVQVWFDAVVAGAMHQGDQMYPVKAHRLRKRNPPPATIWDGSRLKYSLKVQDTTVLLDFFYNVSRYPSSEQKQQLVRQTSMTLKQVSSWFKNHRIRISSTSARTLSNNIYKKAIKSVCCKKKAIKKDDKECSDDDTDSSKDDEDYEP